MNTCSTAKETGTNGTHLSGSIVNIGGAYAGLVGLGMLKRMTLRLNQVPFMTGTHPDIVHLSTEGAAYRSPGVLELKGVGSGLALSTKGAAYRSPGHAEPWRGRPGFSSPNPESKPSASFTRRFLQQRLTAPPLLPV